MVTLETKKTTVDTSLDCVVVPTNLGGIRGGRSLDLTGYPSTETCIKAGHVIIRDTVNNVYKPMPINDGAYASLPANHEYVGILVNTIPVSAPLAGIMNIGQVNEAAAPFAFTSIKSAFKAAVPSVVFVKD